MKNRYLPLLLLIFSLSVSAQEDDSEEQPEGWSTGGNFQLLFNQSAFNKEWTGGGTSSIAGNATFDYDLNFRRGDFTWNSKLLANYGLTKLKADDFARKTSDRLEINTIAGIQLQETEWHYSFFANFRTQITEGYIFGEDPETGATTRTEHTNFLSPAYLQAGPGMMWKKNENLYVNIAPATVRFIFVDPVFTSTPSYDDGDYFGLDEGNSSRFELGASVTGYAKFEVVENVSMENSLNLYSNYLDKPGNIDIDYLLNLEMAINNFLTTNLIFQAIYDDNAVGGFQIREVFGAGINVSL